MSNLATNVISKYLSQDFMPTVKQAIRNATIEKNIVKNMPQVISKDVLKTILDPTIKNANSPPSHLISKTPIKRIHQIMKQGEKIKVPRRKHHSVLSINPQINLQEEEKGSARSNSRITTQSTNLIKLAQDQVEEQDDQIKELRRMRFLAKKFQKMKEQNRLKNQRMKKFSKYEKQSNLNQCPFHHTYDYQSNIVRVESKDLKEFQMQQQHNKSLLESIQSNLDREIAKEKQIKKLQEIRQKNALKKADSIAEGLIEKVEERNGNSKAKKKGIQIKQKEELIDKSIKPLYSFQNSRIKSLSKEMDGVLEEGVKMVTHEERLMEQYYKNTGKQYKVMEQEVIKQKPRKKKEKTHTSQSIVYSLQNQIKNPSILDNFTNPIPESQLQDPKHYQSLQLNQQQNHQNYDALTQLLRRHSRLQDYDPGSRANSIKLPSLTRAHKNSSMKKRTNTEQKLIRGLDSIEIQVKTPKPHQVHFSQRSGHMSALAINKKTESSLEQADHDHSSSRRSDTKSKKQFVRDYYKNYRQQFRHKLKGIQQSINMYN